MNTGDKLTNYDEEEASEFIPPSSPSMKED